MKKYPFKFLDSYNKDDKGIFFGRDEEINALYEMVFQSPVILIYGASGTGKTSLINCGLAGKFEPHDWLALMIRRGNNINESLAKALTDAGGNPATIKDDINWHNEWADETETSSLTLSPVSMSIKAVYQKSFIPVYLIFDQFEELFILGSVTEQEQFIKTVLDILQSEQPVKLIFSIREEYLGHLFAFEQAVPQLLQKKLRIEAMNLEKVKQVIIGAAEYEGSNIQLKPGESGQVAEGIFNKIKGKGKSLTIQLPFLQVFLDKFYLKITSDENREKEAEFTVRALNDMGEIGDILVNFLEEQVTGISKKLSEKYPALTAELTWKILSPFSTLEGTKEPISKQGLHDRLPGQDTAMIDDMVDAFINSRILRYNEAIDMFEIAHDSLAKPIAEKRSVEETALLEIKRLIKSQVAVKDEAREYFSEKQLLFIEPFLQKFKPAAGEHAWIEKSRAYLQDQRQLEKIKQKNELAKTRKRLRIVYCLFGGALLALIAAGYFWNASKKEVIKTTQARDEVSRAVKERTTELIHFAWFALNHSANTGLDDRFSDGYDCKTWLTSGFRFLYCKLSSIVSFEKIQSIAGIPIFRTGGPHDKGLNLDDTLQFGHYNPEFLTWLNDYVIPEGMEDARFNLVTRTVYKNHIGPLARALYHAHQILYADTTAYKVFEQRFNTVKSDYLTNPPTNEGRFVYGGEKPIAFSSIKTTYQAALQQGNPTGFEMVEKFRWLSDYLSVDKKVDWPLANVAGGFWVRRSIDGTDEQIFQLLIKVLKTFEPAVLSQ